GPRQGGQGNFGFEFGAVTGAMLHETSPFKMDWFIAYTPVSKNATTSFSVKPTHRRGKPMAIADGLLDVLMKDDKKPEDMIRIIDTPVLEVI
ncbi:MAG: hypothetical protein P4L44_09955, partial [Oryzomonas sp.]|uniref:hypothetical protein n=1 Tax=Oryzomonas sp. TaxID=2855186 RepID=UPI0028422C9B